MLLPRCALVLFVCAVVVFTCPLSPAAAQSEDPAKGAALLAEARKAIGGEEKLAAVKRLQVRGDMRRGQGNVTLEGDSEIFLEPPDKFRRNQSLGIGLGGPGIERVEILNGNEVIDENTGGGGGGFARGGDFGGGRGQIDPERLKEAQRRARQTEVARVLVAMLLSTSAPRACSSTARRTCR